MKIQFRLNSVLRTRPSLRVYVTVNLPLRQINGPVFHPPWDEEETGMAPSGKVAELNVNSTVSISLSLSLSRLSILYEILASTIPENSNSYPPLFHPPPLVVETVFSFSYIHVYIYIYFHARIASFASKSIVHSNQSCLEYIWMDRRQKWENTVWNLMKMSIYNILSLPLNAYYTTAYAVRTNYSVYLYFQPVHSRQPLTNFLPLEIRIQFIR